MIFTKKRTVILFSVILLLCFACVLSWFLLSPPCRKTDNTFLSPSMMEKICTTWQFSSPGQEGSYDCFLGNHRDWMKGLEAIFGNPWCINAPDAAAHIQEMQKTWDITKREINQEECAAFFGKEFFTLFMQYHQDKHDGITKCRANDIDGAIVLLRRAQACAEKMKKIPIKNRGSLPALFMDKMSIEISICLGAAECLRGNTEKGIAAMRAAYREASEVNWRYGKAQAAYYMALYAQQAKASYTKALYEQALQVAQENKMPEFVWKCYEQLALLVVWTGRVEEAIKYLQEAVIVIESMRTKLQEDCRRTAFMGNKFGVYRLLTVALLEKGDIRQALEVSENAKSRVLQDLLNSQNKITLWGSVACGLVTREQTLSEQIEDLEDVGGKAAEKHLGVLRQEYENVVAQIRKVNPEFGLLKVGGSVDVAEIQALLDDQTVLLEYNLIQDYLIAWLVTKNSIRMKKIPLDAEKLTQKVQAIRMMIGKPKLPAVYKLLGQLYALIIKPFDKEILGKNLIIVPDGALHYLPFVALRDGKGKFLVEKHTISVVPSFTVLKYCMAQKRGKTKTILAFGNPDLNDPKLDLPNAEREVRSIAKQFPSSPGPVLRSDPAAPLPSAELEVKSIAAQFPQTKMYLRKEASETVARTIMDKFDIIHFACHGEMDPVESTLSCLRLAPDADNDGKLTAGEIFDLNLNAQMVVLSGCETGRGVLVGGDEMLGMTRSFLCTGTPCVVVSHWKVDDDATSLLMTSFYKNMATMGKAEALRQAQIATLKVKKHPYYWAAFYLVGDGR